MSIERQFIGWNGSLAELTAKAILAVGKPVPGMKAIDLSSHRVIVPSQFAGRLIREQLAIQSPNGVLLPKIETPESFLNWGDRNLEIANSEDSLLAWIEVLTSKNFNRKDYKYLFPDKDTEEVNFDFQSARTFAQQLIRLRDQLGGSPIAHDFRSVIKICNEEPDRWDNLAKLEDQYLAILKKIGKGDHNQIRTSLATGDGMPEGVDTVWLVSLLDPQPLLLEALERREDKLSIKILIGADETESAGFDEFGRPDTEFWKNRETQWDDFDSTVHVVRDPEHGLDKLSELLNNTKPEFGTLAVIPCERERYPAMINDRLKSLGAESLNPMGKLHGDHVIHHLMASMANLLESKTFANLRKTLLHPTLAKNLLNTTNIEFQTFNLSLDALSSRKPPQDLTKLLNYIKELKDSDDPRENWQVRKIRDVQENLAFIINQLLELERLKDKPNKLGLELLELCKNKDQSVSQYDQEFAEKVSESIEDVLTNLNPESPQGLKLDSTAWIKLALSISREERFRKNFTEEPVNLPGWMEAMWEPVPHLVIFGLTDDLIPQSHNADPFLPSRLRNKLGLTTSENHFANAAFSLERIRRCRTEGTVDIIVPRHDSEGNGLRPSRLFFLCSDNELVKRVYILFESELETDSEPYWNIPKELRLTPVAEPEKLAKRQKYISATAFENYLSNPADFWLKNVLELNETSHDGMELDRAEFGSLIHSALEKFGRNESNRALTDPQQITNVFSNCLDDYFSEAYGDIDGKNDPIFQGIILQRETARDRLNRFATLQAKLVTEGWIIDSVEGILPSVTIEGIAVGGRYDRLDYNPRLKKWRVYDYKSFNEIKTPEQKHIKLLSKSNMRRNPEFQFPSTKTNSDGDVTYDFRWDNLQLPVYFNNLVNRYKDINTSNLEVGYIVLPAEGDAEALIWEDYQAIAPRAEEAIKKILKRILKPDPESFKFTRNSDYPVFPNFSKRKPESYMDITKLGTTEDNNR